MAHHFLATEYLGYITADRKPCRIVKAKYKDMELDILYEDFETGKCYFRNLEFNYISGYLVSFPGEKIRHKYSSEFYIQELEPWQEVYWDMHLTKTYYRDEIDFYVLMENYPQYKFILQKLMKLSETYYISLEDIFGCMRLYNDYPEMEHLICHEFFYLIGNVSIYRYSKKNKKIFMNYLLKNREYFSHHNDLTVREILKCAKCNIKPEHHNFFKQYPDDVCKYLLKNDRWKLGENYYKDYKIMALEMGHNMNDPYWKFPNNLEEAHNKVMNEKIQLEINKNKEKENKMIQAVKSLQKNNKTINGYDIFVANSTEQFVKASEVLSQCLMRANYIDRVIKQESIIVMIWNNNIPIATAEIDYKKQVKQFYGDEKDHTNCKPTEEVQNLFYSWLKNCRFRKEKLCIN